MKRKDSKGRVLKNNEYVKSDGRYAYQYKDLKGIRKIVYSWRLIETDPQPKDKPRCDSLREIEKRIEKDLFDGIESLRKITLNDRWDEYILNKPELKDSTRTNYKYMYDKYIREDIGKMQIQKITYSVIKKFFNQLIYDRGFKLNSLDIINTILHPVFAIAIKDGLLRINPTEGVMKEIKKTNNLEEEKRHALTKEQETALLEFVKNHPVYRRWYSLIVCLLGTGCRIAEMIGLRWEDIHWEDNCISINHNLIYRLQDDGTVKMRITTTKTKNGNREIPLLSVVRSVLKALYAEQSKTGFCKSEIDGYTGFIWMNRFGQVQCFHNLNRALNRIVASYNAKERPKNTQENIELLPHITAHILRHTFCCRLCEQETDLKMIQEIMGHANITTTMDVYNESNMKRKQERFAELDNKLNIL